MIGRDPSCTESIFRNQGLPGLYRGTIPVILKLSTNTIVGFISYNIFLVQMQVISMPKSVYNPVASAMAGVVAVCATMPFDSIKTRLQAIDGNQQYRGSSDCFRSVIRQEGGTDCGEELRHA